MFDEFDFLEPELAVEEPADDAFDVVGPVSLPGEPTEAAPGSEEKIRALTERASRREQLFHPLDGIKNPSKKTWPPYGMKLSG
jgi:hypothetical protein